ncbi:hypothetical protein IJ22_19670 [Paenibacillus naphthalenovorans]|uniref:Uncharacterized protein n=1 Tax=Paenibacillus naphthalenovorans TaxID=162209 RepID=A0A0U2W4B1_9BACL|nr:hypothetical protein IJ22_19670 [Paenibacillus naphthalenovorans]SDJ56254.1 hypothetical protein SAMN05421868_13218 [Paenibacillus naphthalenovorans]
MKSMSLFIVLRLDKYYMICYIKNKENQGFKQYTHLVPPA